MITCRLVTLGNRDDAALLKAEREFPYSEVEIEGKKVPLKFYIEEISENKYGWISRGYMDRVLYLFSKRRGYFQVVVSEKLEIQIYEHEPKIILGVFATKEVAAKIVTALAKSISILPMYFDLTGGYKKIYERFEDVRRLSLSQLIDPYLDKALLYGKKLYKSRHVEAMRVGLQGTLNAVALVYRHVWVLVSRDAFIYTPVKHVPGEKEGFVYDLYKEFEKLGVVKTQMALL